MQVKFRYPSMNARKAVGLDVHGPNWSISASANFGHMDLMRFGGSITPLRSLAGGALKGVCIEVYPWPFELSFTFVIDREQDKLADDLLNKAVKGTLSQEEKAQMEELMPGVARMFQRGKS